MRRAIRWMRRAWVPVLTIAAALSAAPARAQADGDGGGGQRRQPATTKTAVSRVPDRPHSFDVSFNVLWVGPSSLGTTNATMTSNQGTSPFSYFNADGRLASTAGIEARVAYAFTRIFSVEGGLAYRRPTVQWTTTNDFEGAPTTTATEKMSEYGFDAALLVHLRGTAFGRQKRVVPFVLAGAGYLRQLQQGGTLADTGQMFYFGGGLKYLMSRRPGRMSGYGLRVDARVVYRRNGYTPLGGTPVSGVVGGGLFVTF